MEHILLFLFYFCFISAIAADGAYIIVDKDGFTNVRQKPTIESLVLGKILQDQIFYNAMDNCELNGMDCWKKDTIVETENWMPVYIQQFSGVGYVYKKNIKNIADFSQILPQKLDSTTIVFADSDIKLKVTFQNINKSTYIIKGGEYQRYYLITGGHFFPYYNTDGHYVIKEMQITWKGKVEKVNDILFYNYFLNYNPAKNLNENLQLLKGKNGVYFLRQWGGDASEAYQINYVIKDGSVFYNNLIDGCSVPALNMLINTEIEE